MNKPKDSIKLLPRLFEMMVITDKKYINLIEDLLELAYWEGRKDQVLYKNERK